MINVKSNSKLNFHWKVNPYDFSKEKILSLKEKISKKYNIKKDNIKINPEFILLNKDGKKVSVTNDIILNIQKPEFQISLFKEYLKIYDVKNYDFQILKKIDDEINSKINYNLYDKYRRFKINWIKWDNFLSYGENNYFDFSKLKGLVLLNGEPANQSGKTTFAIDLIHFLLFGNTEKSATQDKIFNKHILEATKVTVEGSVTIEDNEYIIKRELSRPSLNKRSNKSKTTQKVEYYRLVKNELTELTDYVDNQQEENTVQTNKIIKETFGNEDDFDMIICATNSNLDSLIEKKESERGKYLSRWIGLLPIEKKDIIAHDHFNSQVKPYLISNKISIAELENNIKDCDFYINMLNNDIKKYENENHSISIDISNLDLKKNELLNLKAKIDDISLKVDINTLTQKIENIKKQGVQLRKSLEDINIKINSFGDVNYSINEYDEISKKIIELNIKFNSLKNEIEHNNNLINTLKANEICPTCKRKLDNINNSAEIEKLTNINIELNKNLADIKSKLDENNNYFETLKEKQSKYNEKSKLLIKQSSYQLQLEKLRNEYKDSITIKNNYLQNKILIDKNNQLDIEINNIENNLKNKRNTKELNIKLIEQKKNELSKNNDKKDELLNQIKKVKEEEILLYHWKIYFDMIGKNGIRKIVLRKTLPIINAQLTNLLCDVCDFAIEIDMNDKNDVLFYLIKDNIKSDLSSGSGFEKTASALAIRAVLGNISTLPQLNGIVLDEILGRVARENYDNMKTLYEKILANFDYIIQISHLDEIKDWHDTIITVVKENNISKLVIKEQNNKEKINN